MSKAWISRIRFGVQHNFPERPNALYSESDWKTKSDFFWNGKFKSQNSMKKVDNFTVEPMNSLVQNEDTASQVLDLVQKFDSVTDSEAHIEKMQW